MSWILGTLAGSPIYESRKARLSALSGTPIHLVDRPNFYLAAGGLADTCFASFADGNPAEGWIVVGVGLRSRDGAPSEILTHTDWQQILTQPHPSLEELEGHFAIIRWKDGRASCYTDQLGLRSLYLAKNGGGVSFSTRLDWVSQLLPNASIDLRRLGSHWLAANQFSDGSLVAGVERLCRNGRAEVTAASIKTSNAGWISGESAGKTVSIEQLRNLLSVKSAAASHISLGISGGLDSRHLLALLYDGTRRYQTHVFGDPHDPDVITSKRIADDLKLPHLHLNHAVPPRDEAIRLARERAAQTCAVSSASSAVKFSTYERLRNSGCLLIDGGFGEIGRRGFYKRLASRGIKDLSKTSVKDILPHLRVRRADVFTPEAKALMLEGLEEELETALRSHAWGNPATDLDLFAIQHRLPNFYGYSLPRLDEQIVNFMPYAQPSFLRSVLQKKVRNTSYKTTIRTLAPELAKYPLVKSGVTHPFRLSELSAYGWTYIRKKFGNPYENNLAHTFLNTVREFILDLAHSREVSTYESYDANGIQSLTTRYFNGERSLVRAVDWWLAFELWRRSLRE